MTAPAVPSTLRNGVPFPVTVEFDTDWACGTGFGARGAAHRLVDRDQDQLPRLRGKAAAGMLRDAAETVAYGLDDGDRAGCWHRWVEVVFGTQRPADGAVNAVGPDGVTGLAAAAPGPAAIPAAATCPPCPAALQAATLRLPPAVRATLAHLPEPSRRLAIDATTVRRPGVCIDPVTGTAAPEKFRVEERAAAGLTVVADWSLSVPGLPDDAPLPWEMELLLLAAAQLVEAIGGRRRRGAGRCRLRLHLPPPADSPPAERPPDRLAQLLDQLDHARPPVEALPAAVDATHPAPVALRARPSEQLEHRCDLRITVDSPLLVASRVQGNTVRGERHLPGTALLPAVAAALGDRATELITSGRVVVTHATLEIAGRRSLPVPRAVQADKAAAALPGDAPAPAVNRLRSGDDHGLRLRPVTGYGVVDDDGDLWVAEPARVAQAHAVVDDQAQRPNEESGGLYVYEALAPGTVLRAQVWLPADVPLDKAALMRRRRLGRSKKDDYGAVTVEVVEPPADPAPSDVGPDDGELLVWLTSDVLLRGAAGEPVAQAEQFAAALGDALGVRLELPPVGDDLPGPASAMVTTSRVESWHTRWTLPRPSLTGLAAGSVLRLRMTGRPDPAAYERVRRTGLGERTAEGYGRLELQPALLWRDRLRLRRGDPGSDGGAAPARDESRDAQAEATAMVRTLLLRGWRRELRRCAVTAARKDQVRQQLVPADATAAQLGTLRTLADRLAADGDPTAARDWLDHTCEHLERSKQWGAERLAGLTALFKPAPSPSSGDDASPDLWQLLDADPPAELRDELYWPALAALLSEAARTAATRPTTQEVAP